MTIDLDAVRTYLARSARPVDAAHFAAAMGDEDAADTLVAELARFQNADGGFGHALEPDLRQPDSSTLATTVAFQYLADADGPAVRSSPVTQRAIRFLRDTYLTDERRWRPIAGSTTEHPSAPWWDSAGADAWTDWGNPSAEALADLIRFSDPGAPADILIPLIERAVARLDELDGLDEAEFHELICFRRLHDALDEPTQQRLWPRLGNLIVAAVEPDPDSWVGYGATPLTFVDRPGSRFADLFDPALVDADLRRLVAGVVDDDHWEPNWTWGDHAPDTWALARAEWSGVLTVRNALTLHRFGRA